MKAEIHIHLAVEDELSELVLRRILQERPVHYDVRATHGKTGSAFLKKRTEAFNNMAKAFPVLLLTDLDRVACAPELVRTWLGKPKHSNFLFRVAVREVEAWLLATGESFGSFLGLRRQLPTANSEDLPDPKNELLKIAMGSPRRERREALVRRDAHGTLRQGPAYNAELAEFVANDWPFHLAAARCPSLGRLVGALAELEKRYAA